MKYIWIVMLIIIDIIWFIASLKDFINTAKRTQHEHIVDDLEDYTNAFILLHLIVLFTYSLALFIKGLE